MAPTESEIRNVISQGYYPSSVEPLEAYLNSMAKGDAPYLFDAVRTLVKLYQLYPETCDDEMKVARCLMLALLRYPATDLTALFYMVPHILTREPFGTIRKCGEHLDACRFGDFWKEYAVLQSSGDAVVSGLAISSVEQLQKAILDALALSYKEAPASVVTSALNVDSVKAVETLKHSSVEKVSADSVVFVSTPDNTKRERVYQEGVTFATISSLLSKMSQ